MDGNNDIRILTELRNFRNQRNYASTELRSEQIDFEIHPVLPVFDKGEEVGVFQADMIVQGKLIIELKAVDALAITHSVQLINYLADAQIEDGLLLNFGTKSLQFKTKTRTSPSNEPPTNPPNLLS